MKYPAILTQHRDAGPRFGRNLLRSATLRQLYFGPVAHQLISEAGDSHLGAATENTTQDD